MKMKWNKKVELKKVLLSGLCVIFSVFVLGGCETKQKKEESQNLDLAELEESDKQQEVEESQEVSEREFLFEDLADLEFYFSSGVGAWWTELYIHEDGTFDGVYRDSDMGVTGEEYPDGTMYYCDFSGKFTQLEKVDDYTYSMQIEHLEYAHTEGDEEIVDGIRYIYSLPYGLDNAEKLLIYLPGIALDELPEEYLSWVGYYSLNNTTDTTLPYYGIYNVTQKYGFSSFEYVENAQAEN